MELESVTHEDKMAIEVLKLYPCPVNSLKLKDFTIVISYDPC